MNGIVKTFLCTTGLLFVEQATAQVTLDQLDAVMAEESDTLEAFRARLQDPNPIKARAAMRLLIEQGDDAQRRLAIAHGFETTDPLARLEAVKAILDAKPLLLFRWEPEDDGFSVNLSRAVYNFDGDIVTTEFARVPIQVSGFSDELGCWTIQPNNHCFARLNSGELSVRFFNNQGWAQFVLRPDGNLVGRPVISGARVDASVDMTK